MDMRDYKPQLLLKDKVAAVLREEVDGLKESVSGIEAKTNKIEENLDNSLEEMR